MVLVHTGSSDVAAVADGLWYPVWDEGLKLGHAVRTPKEALTLAASDLDTATSLLEMRHLAGDVAITADLAERATKQWQKRSKRWLAQLGERAVERHHRAGEVAFLLEPDLKEGRGGLRDVHTLRWAERARPVLQAGDDPALAAAYETLLEVRVALHRTLDRPSDVLHLQEQDGVARMLRYDDADALMKAVAEAARTIAWTSDEVWDRIESSLAGPRARTGGRERAVGAGVVLRDGEVHLVTDADPGTDPTVLLRAARAAVQHGARIDRQSLDRLAAETPRFKDPWPEEARHVLADVLLGGPPAVQVLESLDQRGMLVTLIPEWEAVRSRPQRNAYHRFTVDRHLMEAATRAALLAERVRRPDLLVIGALLHDIGKGYPGDHTAVGEELVRTIATRMAFSPEDVDTLVSLVRYHLLLPDVATRRDLADDATITRVAEQVGSVDTLELLAALTEADSIATGPAAWGDWKAGLVRELVGKTAHVLGGGEADELGPEPFPTDAHRQLMAAGRTHVAGVDQTLTVVARDRPGVFSRVAGVLALNGLDVLEASAASEDGMALSEFVVESSFGPAIAWDRVGRDVERALDGRLALQARLTERAQLYARPTPLPARSPTVTFDNEATPGATVIEVHAEDAIGVLYRITAALAELDLDIQTAKVSTLGHEVVDAFYVRDAGGAKITDGDHLEEIRRAVLHALS